MPEPQHRFATPRAAQTATFAIGAIGLLFSMNGDLIGLAIGLILVIGACAVILRMHWPEVANAVAKRAWHAQLTLPVMLMAATLLVGSYSTWRTLTASPQGWITVLTWLQSHQIPQGAPLEKQPPTSVPVTPQRPPIRTKARAARNEKRGQGVPPVALSFSQPPPESDTHSGPSSLPSDVELGDRMCCGAPPDPPAYQAKLDRISAMSNSQIRNEVQMLVPELRMFDAAGHGAFERYRDKLEQIDRSGRTPGATSVLRRNALEEYIRFQRNRLEAFNEQYRAECMALRKIILDREGFPYDPNAPTDAQEATMGPLDLESLAGVDPVTELATYLEKIAGELP